MAIKLSKKEKEKLKGKTYKTKVQTLIKKYAKKSDINQYISSQYAKWGITQLDRKSIARLSKQEQTRYYRREYSIIQGKYDIKRKKQWKENYRRAMEKSGIDREVIEEFVKIANVNNIDLLSRDLAGITTWYIQNNYGSTDDTTKQVQTIIKEIKRGRYHESSELYKTRIAEQVEDTKATLNLYKKKSLNGKKRR